MERDSPETEVIDSVDDGSLTTRVLSLSGGVTSESGGAERKEMKIEKLSEIDGSGGRKDREQARSVR